ncbi:MAG: protein translocase subunit SecF [Micrococcales bacterium]|nr:protein translocase subunit SecF [Micrococcales bacterium]
MSENKFAVFGNDLYTGKRSIDFVGKLRTWLLISVALLVIVGAGLAIRGLNLGIEFTGGSDFRVPGVTNTSGYVDKARGVVSRVGSVSEANVTLIGSDTVRVETERFDDRRAQDVSAGLAKAFSVPDADVSASIVGPSWGASVSQKALQAIVWFLALVSILLGVYFRTWKMAFAALVALFHDIFITVGVYALTGFEVTPASTIGFLTILGYSLYDTVVVFDKVRENTTEASSNGRRSYSQAANLAVNQTLVRSINTSVVALLPVGAILVMGFTVIGPGTLLDLSLALFVGIAVGTYSSIFIATPLLAWLREREPAMKDLAKRAARYQERAAIAAGARADSEGAAQAVPVQVFGSGGANAMSTGPADSGVVSGARSGSTSVVDLGDAQGYTATGRPLHPSLREGNRGPRNQPKKRPRSQR